MNLMCSTTAPLYSIPAAIKAAVWAGNTVAVLRWGGAGCTDPSFILVIQAGFTREYST